MQIRNTTDRPLNNNEVPEAPLHLTHQLIAVIFHLSSVQKERNKFIGPLKPPKRKSKSNTTNAFQAINRYARHLGDTCFNRTRYRLRWNNCQSSRRSPNDRLLSSARNEQWIYLFLRQKDDVTMEANSNKLEHSLSPLLAWIRVYPPLFNGIYYTHVAARERELSYFHNAAAITRNKWRRGFMKICNSKGTNVLARESGEQNK